jgi:hypothetical protein
MAVKKVSIIGIIVVVAFTLLSCVVSAIHNGGY